MNHRYYFSGHSHPSLRFLLAGHLSKTTVNINKKIINQKNLGQYFNDKIKEN